MPTQTHQVNCAKPTDIVRYSIDALPILGSKSAVKKAITNQQLLVNGQVANFRTTVKKGDTLVIKLTKTTKKTPKGLKHFSIDIVYEDDYLLVANKPAGIAVNGNRNKTLENALLPIFKKSSQADALPNPLAAHRIDVPTKGLVILGKTKTALIGLNKAFQHHQVQKTYVALVHGKPPLEGTISHNIEDKAAITHFERIATTDSRIFRHLSLVKLRPITGRTHQLRIHLQKEGHLIVGDKLYAKSQKTILGKGLFLCATALSLQHPITKKSLRIEIDTPNRFYRTIERETQRNKRPEK